MKASSTVGERIKNYLEKNGISQIHVSMKSQIPAAKLNLALNGKRKLTFEEYEMICWALGVNGGTFITPHPPINIKPKS